MKKIGARFYANDNGEEPVRSWLLKLSKADRVAIGKEIQTVEFGWPKGLSVEAWETGCTKFGAILLAGALLVFSSTFRETT